MSFYLFLNLIIIFIPLALSFEQRVQYIKKWPAVFLSIVVVGGFYVAWDVGATGAGHWSFNARYVGADKIFGLPIEEILFFVTTPFSCLFIYEVLSYFKNDVQLTITKNFFYFCICFLLIASFFNMSREYSVLSFVACASFILLTLMVKAEILCSKNFWIYLAICYGPFLIFNGILTGLPVVLYDEQAIMGFRVFTIPIEDFFYNFSFLGFAFLVYQLYPVLVKRFRTKTV